MGVKSAHSFTTPTRQLTLPQPTDEPEVITEAALRLFGQIWTSEQAVQGRDESRKLRAERGVNMLEPLVFQLLAFSSQLSFALAAIQARFGVGAVRRASEMEES